MSIDNKFIDYPHPPISKYESLFYIFTWITVYGKLAHSLYLSSLDFKNNPKYSFMLMPGWSFIENSMVPKSNYDWYFFRDVFVPVLGKWFMVLFVINLIFRYFNLEEYRKPVYIVYSIYVLLYVLTIKNFLFITVNALITIIGAIYLKSKSWVWLTSLFYLVIINIDFAKEFLHAEEGYHNLNSYLYSIFWQFGMVQFTIKLVSVGLYIVEMHQEDHEKKKKKTIRKEKKQINKIHYGNTNSKNINFNDSCKPKIKFDLDFVMNIVCYLYHVPLFVYGYFVKFDYFQNQFNIKPSPWKSTEFLDFVINLLRCLFWGVAVNLMYHYFYYTIFAENPNLLSKESLWSIASIGIVGSQIFMIRWLVTWCFTSTVAKIDNIITTRYPICIANHYLYSKFWQGFDSGMHVFLKEYIYFALGGSKQNSVRRLFALFVTFAFVLIWHGVNRKIFIWTCANALLVLCESIPIIKNTRHNKSDWMSPYAKRKLNTFATVPLAFMSTVFICIFYGKPEIGYLILYKILIEGFPTSLITIWIFLSVIIEGLKSIENYQYYNNWKKVEKRDDDYVITNFK